MQIPNVRFILQALGGGARKALGQHFLMDVTALRAVVDGAGVAVGDRVLEIGPGPGTLTRALLERGASVVAIEKDRRFVAWLREQHQFSTARIIEGDATTVDWDEAVGPGPWKLVANLPYAITSFALRLALFARRPPTHVSVLVQREVAQRAIDLGNTSLLSLMVGLSTRSAKIARRVPAGAFFPPPKVESAVLTLDVMSPEERIARWGIEPEAVMALAKRGFAHPRKRLASNLGLRPDVWDAMREGIVDNPDARAETLLPGQWAALARAWDNHEKSLAKAAI